MYITKYQERGEHLTHIHFESMTDSMEYFLGIREGRVKLTQSHNQEKASEYSSADYVGRERGDWTGFTNDTDFMNAMRYGDMEKAKALWEMESPELQVESIRRRVKWGEIGDAIDVQKMYRGEFDKAWRTTVKRKSQGGSRNITLLVNLGANCNVSSENLGWRGMASLKIADLLSEAGYNVRLLGYSMGEDDCQGLTNTSLSTVPIKDFDEGMDVPKLAAIMCRAAYFRTVVFCSRTSIADSLGTNVDYGLGRSAGLDSDSWKAKFFMDKVYGEEGQMVFIPTVEGKEDCLREMDKILAKYQVQD